HRSYTLILKINESFTRVKLLSLSLNSLIMRKLSLIVMFCHLLSCPAFAQSPSKGYKAGLSAVIYRIHSARQ
ncbi:hypothetical protein, partial [Bacteroides xylanisolvens]